MSQALKRLHRVLWHLQRTPVAPLAKHVLRVSHAGSCRRRKRLARSLDVSSAADVAASAFAAEGFAVLDNVICPDTLGALDAYALSRLQTGPSAVTSATHTHKGFWTRLSDGESSNGAISHRHAMVQFAIQARLVGFLARVYGEIPQLSEVLLSLSKHTPQPTSYSQLWHRDYDDIKTVKVFVYHTDTGTTGDGPFTFVPGPASDRLALTLRSHLSDADLFSRVKRNLVREVKAGRLACFAVETSRCWHMGSRMADGRHRLMYTATYIRYPRIYGEPPPRFRVDGAAGPVETALLFRD